MIGQYVQKNKNKQTKPTAASSSSSIPFVCMINTRRTQVDVGTRHLCVYTSSDSSFSLFVSVCQSSISSLAAPGWSACS